MKKPIIWLLSIALMLAVVACGTEVPQTPVPEPTEAPAPTEEPVEEEPAEEEPTEEPAEEEPEPAEEEPAEEESSADSDAFKIAFVYVAPIGDLGWSYSHDQARLAVEEEFGDKVETTFIENVPEGPDAERVIRDFAQKGFDLIITTSFGFMDPTITVAEEFPDIQFVHISGFKTADNASNVFGRMYQPRYLSGLAAGAATESNIIGYVAAFPIPEVLRGINAFTLGVRESNPDAEVRVVWTNTWFGPPEEKEAAEALLGAGADVIAQHQDTTEPQKAAADAGGVSVSYNTDMSEVIGDSVLTGPTWDWSVKYLSIVEELMDGSYDGSESYWGGLDDGIVGLAPFSSQVSDDTKALIGERQEMIADGKWDVFCGPITGANGNVVVPEGNCLTDPEMLSMDYFVEGVEGEAPAEAGEGLGEPSDMAAMGGAMEEDQDEAMEETGDPMKIAFVYVAPIGDLGWTYSHDQARLAVEEEFGDKVETTFIENVPEGPDAERVIRDFAQKGFDLIITTSFGFMDPTITVAEEFPDIQFVHISGFKTADNASNVFGRMYQPRYLSGLAAGAATESNIIGYVAAFPIPEVIRGINAFTLGVRESNPDAEVRVVWTNTWFGPPEEKEAAEALLGAGADVIAQHQDTTEPQKAAADAGGVSVSYNTDMSEVVGDSVLTGPTWDWSVKYLSIVEELMDGSYDGSESYWGGLDDGVVGLAPFSSQVSDDTKTLIGERQDMIADGKWDVFCGPITGANGNVVVPEGNCLTDPEMLSMDYFVEGVEGEAPAEAPEGLGEPSDMAAMGGAMEEDQDEAMEETGDPFKIAFVYVAPIGDLGWTYSHDQARLAVEEEFGDKVETAFIENVPEGPEAERVIRDFAQKGFDLIITTSFGFMDPTITVAEEFPDIQFVHISGFKTADNASNVFGRMYQPRYLSGLAAGAATESNIIGYVAAFPIPEVLRGINAFTLGVREVNPDAEVRVVWTNTWFGPPEEKEAAEALLGAGADVIAQHQDTTEPQKAAADAGGVSVSYNTDMSEVVGDSVLTGPTWDWSVKYLSIVEELMDGSYDGSESYWGGLDDGIVGLAPFSSQVSDDTKTLIGERQDMIADGKWDVFCGPITGANGTVFVSEGNCLTDPEMLSMDYFVEGVSGEAPAEAPEGLGEPSDMAAMGGAMEDNMEESDEAIELTGEPIKVAFVYVAPIGDLGWTYSHDQARLTMEEELGEFVETAFIENVPEGPDAERVIRDFAQKEFNLIITTSFGFMDPTITVAEEFPDTKFVHISGFKTADNVSTVFGRMYQPRYLSGLAAGAATESNIIGYVAAFPIPEVIRGINAFTLGVRESNPDAEVRVVWTNTWFGPPEEKEAAEALLGAGADVIAQHQDTTEPQKAAADAGGVSVSYNTDMSEVVGDTVLTGPVWDWSGKYTELAASVINDTFVSESYWGGLDEGIVGLAPYSSQVSDDTQTLIEEKMDSIVAGEWDVFCGPVTGANGNLVVEEDKCLTDTEMLSMDYFVEGVSGEAPAEAPEGLGE